MVRAVLARLRREEGGNAVVEFLGVTLVLLIPLVYLVLTLGRVQAAVFAAEAGAREAGRILSQADDLVTAVAQAQVAVDLAFADHGIEVDATRALVLECDSEPCLTPGGRIQVEVATTVDLPLVPDFLGDTLPLEVPVHAVHLAAVPEFRSLP